MSAPMDALCKEAAKLKLEGNELFKAKKYEAAASKYREAIDKDQCNAVYYTNLCACLNQLKLYKEMNTVASKCIAMNENSVKGHYWLIMSFKKQKKYKEAFVQCDSSLEKFPDNSDIKLLQAEISMKVKRCANEKCPVLVANQVDLFQCSACKDTSGTIDTYYCSRDCQKSDWPRHKTICQVTSKQACCSLCKKMFDYEKKVLCQTCKAIFYCSDKCKEEDKEQHQRVQKCRPFSKEMELFEKWYESEYAVPALSELATHAMTKQEFLSNDLEFFVSINLRFCGRYCSFVPIEPPKIVYKSHMNPEEKEFMSMIKKKVGSLNLCQVILVKFAPRDGGNKFGQFRVQGYTSVGNYQRLTFEEAMTSNFNHVNCRDNPIIPPTWKNNYSEHLAHWAAEAKENGVLVDFVLASLGYQSKASQKSSENYAVILEFIFGEQFGEIKGLLSHDIMDISGITWTAKMPVKRISKNTCDENHVEFSLTMVCKHGSGFYTLLPIQISLEQISAFQKKDYDDEVMEKLWQDLLKIPFPKCPPTPEYPDI
ncbi:hypothetical protein CTEN210_02730 [Chaetoceros tenuissimus]|uniref:MYND-type domain-containing protein n=1 Tax=Chaetoceros tenuissimus TaxID=426638 RepID=A0AAD3CI32_9STRA|nr:hypothetical protein CTEN210_02730 [Chaetoceros tenuissimus]